MPPKAGVRIRNHSANGNAKRRRTARSRSSDSSEYITFRMFSLTPTLDHALRKRAAEEGTTMNDVIREILTRELRR